MGLIQSTSLKQLQNAVDEEDDDDDDEEEDQEDDEDQVEEDEEKEGEQQHHRELQHTEKKVEQEPELVPLAAAESPVSRVSTPHLRPGIRVWDPGHLLTPVSLQAPGRSHNRIADAQDEICTEIYFIRHGESDRDASSGLIGGLSPSAMLTAEGKRQARALGVFLLSHGSYFDAVFSSPLERAKQTTISVCQEVNFPQDKIEYRNELVEMSQGLWEGLRMSDVCTPELQITLANSRLDFHPPGGESQRQVEFRMVEFVNEVLLPKVLEALLHKDARHFRKESKSSSLMQVHPLQDADEARTSRVVTPLGQYRNLAMKGSGKSRLHVASNGETAAVGASSASEHKAAPKPAPYQVAVFSHAMSIKCLLRGLLGSDPQMTHRLSIDNTSMTVLKHSTQNGWQILRVNDTAHLRLL